MGSKKSLPLIVVKRDIQSLWFAAVSVQDRDIRFLTRSFSSLDTLLIKVVFSLRHYYKVDQDIIIRVK